MMLRVSFAGPADLPAAIAAAREALRAHGVIALPTETFYGLGVDPRDATAVERVFDLKGRPVEKALLVVGSSVEQLAALVDFPPVWGDRLAAAWPAPFSAVLPVRAPVAAGGATLAVRVPAYALLRGLLARAGPLTATSANRSGRPPCTSADEVERELGEVITLLLDGGRTPGGAASTLLDCTSDPPRVLRAGAWVPPADWRALGA